MVIVTLAHHIDLAWMYEAYRQTRKNGAVGIDEVTAAEYAADLDGNLRSLLERCKSGSYFAPPVRRVLIPKGDGRKTRPIGIPTPRGARPMVCRAGPAAHAGAYSEASHFAVRHYEPARKYFQKKRSKTNGIIANRALAHKLARASFYVMRDQVDFDPDRLFR